MKNICLFGGTFDPIHEGHLMCAKEVVRQLPIDKVVFLPAARSPFKTGKSNLFTDSERLALLQRSVRNFPWAEVSTLDLELPKPSYSWHIVEYYKTHHPDMKLYWAMGADQWDELEKWGNYEYLVKNLHFIVFHRGHAPVAKEGVTATFVSGTHPASATRVREMLIHDEEVPEDWVAPDVVALARNFLMKN